MWGWGAGTSPSSKTGKGRRHGKKKKKIRQEQEEEQRGRKGAWKSAGLDGEAPLQRQGKVSKVVPLDHTGTYRKKKCKGRRKNRRWGEVEEKKGSD